LRCCQSLLGFNSNFLYEHLLAIRIDNTARLVYFFVSNFLLVHGGATMKLTVNGVECQVASDWENENLLMVLREHLGLPGTRFSCGIGQCGACVVHVDGAPISSCLIPVADVAGKNILTIEGLADENGTLHPLQQAWIDESVPQCGYCQSGQIMQALALLKETPDPDDSDINRAMNGNLCRCGTYDRIKKSIKRAAVVMQVLD
jgi:isoquinoline 1-oxidoreductase subunit alpha